MCARSAAGSKGWRESASNVRTAAMRGCGLVEPLEKEAAGLVRELRFEVVEARHYRGMAQPPALPAEPSQPPMLTGE